MNATPEKNLSIPEHNADPKTSQFSFGGFEDEDPDMVNSQYLSNQLATDEEDGYDGDYKEFWTNAEQMLGADLDADKRLTAKDDPFHDHGHVDDRMRSVE